MESFFGTHPGVASEGIVATGMAGNTFTFRHPQNPAPANDVAATYRWSSDLHSGNDDGATSGGTTVNFTTSPGTPTEGTTTVTATVTGTMPARLFTDLKVTRSMP